MKSEAAPLPTSISPTTKPVTASENVNVAVNGALLVAGTPVIPTVGAVLSTSYVFSFVPVGVVFASAVSAVSVMFCPPANDSVTVASRLARSPPDAVTSYTVEAVTTFTTGVAVVPLTVKSAASTFCTSSLNVMRQVRLSAFVGGRGRGLALDGRHLRRGGVARHAQVERARRVRGPVEAGARPEVGMCRIVDLRVCQGEGGVADMQRELRKVRRRQRAGQAERKLSCERRRAPLHDRELHGVVVRADTELGVVQCPDITRPKSIMIHSSIFLVGSHRHRPGPDLHPAGEVRGKAGVGGDRVVGHLEVLEVRRIEARYVL